jgi:uncharacterized NAD(P)/FAD-binding protein YdhS
VRADHADLAFIGGGVSSVATLERLLEEARGSVDRVGERVARTGRPIRIFILDKGGDFGGGVPYGNSVPTGFLCNEPVGKQHSMDFAVWLHECRDDWLGMLSASGDPAVRRWLATNAAALRTARSDPAAYAGLFVPRVVYGDFVRQKLKRALTAARATRLFEVLLRHEWVTSIERAAGNGLRLGFQGGGAVTAGLAVVAVGSPPPRPEPQVADRPEYVHTPCGDAVARLAAGVLRSIEAWQPAPREVAILGSNACALEMMSLLDTRRRLRRGLAGVTVISRGGRLPDARPSGKADLATMARLEALGAEAGLTAAALFEAARDDVAVARDASLTALDYAEPLYARFGPLLARLEESERRRFVEKHGRRFKALTRHTPPEYRRAAEDLAARGLLRIVHGVVLAIEVNSSGFRILFRDPSGKEEACEAAVVLDCRGWGYLDEAPDLFLRSLLSPQAGLARMNGSRIGLAVDEDLQASEGVFVMGPLLAGVCNRKHMIWNLENARRIFALAPALASALAYRLFGPYPSGEGTCQASDERVA